MADFEVGIIAPWHLEGERLIQIVPDINCFDPGLLVSPRHESADNATEIAEAAIAIHEATGLAMIYSGSDLFHPSPDEYMTRWEVMAWAKRTEAQRPRCSFCGDRADSLDYTHAEVWDGERFCSMFCAEEHHSAMQVDLDEEVEID